MKTRLRKAKLRQNGSVEDIDFRYPRDLDRSLVLRLADCQWIKDHNNLIITGPTGAGKSFLACAFGVFAYLQKKHAGKDSVLCICVCPSSLKI